MLEIVVLVFLFTMSFRTILDKYRVIDKLIKHSTIQQVSRTYYKMMQCDFCITHHLSIIPTIIFGFIFGFEYYYFFVPLLATGIKSTIEKWKLK